MTLDEVMANAGRQLDAIFEDKLLDLEALLLAHGADADELVAQLRQTHLALLQQKREVLARVRATLRREQEEQAPRPSP